MSNKKLVYLIGLPGSGKSTLSYLLYKKIKCCHIISSQSILKLVSSSSATYLQSNYINRGLNIPDDLYVDLIKKN